MHIIYKYTNKCNNKVYIGQTKNSLEERAQHNGSNYRSCTHFYNAIQKYGWNNFQSEILEEVNTIEEANKREMYYISLFDSTNPKCGYNISFGGNCGPISEVTKKKISDIRKEQYKDPANNPMYGKKHSDETLEKMREKKMGVNNPMYGKHLSRESIDRRNATKRLNNSFYRPTYTDEQKAIISKRAKKIAQKWAKKVRCIEDDLSFESTKAAAIHYGVDPTTLRGHLKGKQHTCAGGRHFEYIN